MKDLVIRSISGAVYVAVIAAALLLNVYVYGAVALFILYFLIKEYYDMTMRQSYSVAREVSQILCCLVFIADLVLCVNGADPRYALYGLLVIPVVMSLTLFNEKERSEFSKTAYLYVAMVYFVLPMCLLNRFVAGGPEFKGPIILLLMLIIWASDSGAYCIGCWLGRNGKKMCPTISPHKSWWGFFGGLLFAAIVGGLVALVPWLNIPWYHGAIMAVLMHCAGVLGDLFESQWKRSCGVKDSGKIIPGHGGMMDRFDSSLFAIPVAIAYLFAFGLI